MELTLKSHMGLPQDAVLSIKIGDMRRQSPLSKVGQALRFSSSPVQPLPMKAELFVPAADPQVVPIDPLASSIAIEFGEGKFVDLDMREVKDLRSPPVDIGTAAKSKGLPAEKLQMAQDAASYLEQHDLVRAFQDILHGLLVSRPEEPWLYIDEHLSRVRKIAESVRGGDGKEEESKPPGPPPPEPKKEAEEEGEKQQQQEPSSEPPTAALAAEEEPAKQQQTKRRKRRSRRERADCLGASKVDALLKSLMDTKQNLPIVMPFLPKELHETLTDPKMDVECRSIFATLDTTQSGKLRPSDLIPLVVQLTETKSRAVSPEQCANLLTMFDANEDGVIQLDELATLVQFIVIASFLDTADGKKIMETAHLEHDQFNSFLRMIEEDRERLWDIFPLLPDWLLAHLSGEAFHREALAKFDELDANRSGVLEPDELLPVVVLLSKAHPLGIDLEKCKRFVTVFDVYKNGVITRDEFVDFVQFLTVMNFLDSTTEGEKMKATTEQESKMAELLLMLKDNPKRLPEVLPHLPKALVHELAGAGFREACLESFRQLDPQQAKLVPVMGFFPAIRMLCAAHPFSLTVEQYEEMTSSYAVEKDGFINLEDCVRFAQTVIVMAFLSFACAHARALAAELLLGADKINQLLIDLKEGASKIDEIIPFLPADLKADIMSAEFERICLEDFVGLDKNDSGVLEPAELMPVLVQLSEAHHFSLTDDHCKRFVAFFDIECNGVLTKAEFINFARFMLIMAYLETEEGQVAQDAAEMVELVESEKRIEALLKELKNDRAVVHKVIPYMPEEVFQYLSSQEFILSCRAKFLELDKDCSGTLEPSELFPVIVELSDAHIDGVDYEHCQRFCSIFDLHGDGVIRKEEFLDFARFLCIMGYLRSHDGSPEVSEATAIFHGDKKIQDLLNMLEHDKRQTRKVIPYCPLDLQDYLLGEEFVMTCVERFRQLDRDQNGYLDPAELFPVVCDMAGAHSLAIDADQCVRFTSMWDDAGKGYMNLEEFMQFARFSLIMGFLKTADGQKILAEVASMPDLTVALVTDDSLAGGPEIAPTEGAETWATTDVFNASESPVSFEMVPRPPGAGSGDQAGFRGCRTRNYGVSSAEVGHLSVDCDYYQRRAEKLAEENEALRKSARSQDERIRKLERMCEEQEMRLRHAEVDLKAQRLKLSSTA